MAAAYDKYDYPSYWIGRDYEHESESVAIKKLLEKVPVARTTLEIGAGFGRLTPIYSYRAKKMILTDPSARLLKIARDAIDFKNVSFIQTGYEKINEKVRSGTIDLVFMIRVIHHVTDYKACLTNISRLLKSNGFMILEFPNRVHFKSNLKEILKGNFTYPYEIFPKDISKKSRKKKIPFINYHPDDIIKTIEESGFEVVEKRSVSNFRSLFLKKIFPTPALVWLEDILQKPLANINFGPSIFLLVQKKG